MMGGMATAPQAVAVGEMPSKKVCKSKPKDPVVAGGCIATDRKKGNCMACHSFAGLEKTRLQAGNVGPPLVAMKQRFKDKKKLRAQIWDATKANPQSMMPPFGRHKILSEKDIDLITAWALSL
ncbi:MAG: sulfur oxidation c-type cytochrome SoxX [Gammaproteobacteria bacterium]|nr:sulfur oxidation c-type cytochrome SoxX [Gammaproteobacteria bacterium]